MIDTHAHLLKRYYDEDLETLVSNAFSKLDKVINIAFSKNSSKEVSQLSLKYENMFNVVGIHPNDVKEVTDEDINEIENLINSKTVAIGEIGLDYHYEGYDKAKQKEVFIKLIEVAKRNNLPVVIHSREANEDTIEIIKDYKDVNFLFHSWSGTVEQTTMLNSWGNIWFSFNGIITFKNAESVRDALKAANQTKIVLETDAPYLTPVPFRGKKNYPEYVQYVYEEVEKLIGLTEKEIDMNVKGFFGI